MAAFHTQCAIENPGKVSLPAVFFVIKMMDFLYLK